MEHILSEERELTQEQEYYSWVILWRTAKAVLKVRQRELRQCGLSPAQSSVLSIVHTWDNQVTPAQISRELMRDANTITELLISMEKDGLVKRVKDLPRKNHLSWSKKPSRSSVFSRRARKPRDSGARSKAKLGVSP